MLFLSFQGRSKILSCGAEIKKARKSGTGTNFEIFYGKTFCD